MQYNLSVSIVLFNTDLDEIRNVIDTLLLSKLNLKIYLVDNSPTDGIKGSIPLNEKIEYIHTGNNLGFGSGHNIAMNKAITNSEFHLVLNADVDFNIGILDKIYNYMLEHPEIGLLAPKIFNPDGTIQYSAKLLPTPANLIVRRFIPIKALQNKLDNRYELRFLNFDHPFEVPYVMGCFMFINCKVLQKVGGFDERFFMYPEDIDLTRRIHKVAKTVYYPDVTITHSHGKGSYKSSRLLYYHITSMIKYFNKWGWVFDKDRRAVNRKIRAQFQ